ncbi:phage minor head protein [Pelagibius sp.]|uniref:phage minor head protein n=1 Tax=Pelagibius sp. TaxID=1931238 RepID=UPI003BB12C1E
MARRPTPRQRIDALLDRLEPGLRRAFMDAVNDIRSRAELGRIVERLEVGDIEGALRSLHIDRAAFGVFEDEIRQAFTEGGRDAAEQLPRVPDLGGGRLVLRFDARNPRVERILADHSATLVTRIIDDMRQASRQVLAAGQVAGSNPRITALDLIGRVSRASGRREGGILGLTAQQEGYLASARAELLSGDPAAMRNYLTRERRDRRFDRQVAAAIREGRALTRIQVSKITGRYSDRLLQLRGEAVARTETLSALNAGKHEAAEQMIEQSGIDRQTVTKVWRATRDGRTRDSHASLNGQTVGMDARFSNGLLYPGEPGAPAAEIVNCRCTPIYRVDHLSGLT